ncbi:Phospholipid scramblase 1, variant 3 [Schistosoma haematobium]|uniref:Phospholipid scramblase n=2 Tax=Schistosoma haematobium TaxID=6185 RepID=A0A922IN16_SCHHA|nr:Phospholipid scramblase 1, variant 3 [Schistosoma haematobium]KAH9583355.1 Phospholipid scramblase 1, variant 3 [Schistosoma haematobium]
MFGERTCISLLSSIKLLVTSVFITATWVTLYHVMWMQRPAVINCPPGLEYLTQIDQLLIKQVIDAIETFVPYEVQNRYTCYNTLGQSVYRCYEESDFCSRAFCGASRPFVLHILNNNNSEVIRAIRPFRCDCYPCCSCLECCQEELEVQSPAGNCIGYVKRVFSGCNLDYHILDNNQSTVLQIHGPSCCFCECLGSDIIFKVTSADGTVEIGRITRKWSNIVQEFFTDADNFGVSFPMDLDVKVKAILLAAVFLIDFKYFEKKPKQ